MTKFFLLLSLCLSITTLAEGYRTFTDSEGRITRARILKVHRASNKVTMERENKKTITIPISIFSEGDQEHILSFVSPLELNVLSDETSWKKISQGRKQKETEYSLQYTTNEPLSKFRLEYCIYRDRMILGDEFVQVDAFTKEIESPLPGEQQEITLYAGISYTDSADFLNDCVGFAIRFYLTTPDGRELIQETKYPSNLDPSKYEWNTPLDKSISQNNNKEIAKLFMDPAKLVINPFIIESEWDDDDDDVHNRESKRTYYRLLLKNKTALNFTGLRIDFCIFRDRLVNNESYLISKISTTEVDLLAANEGKNVICPGIHASFKIEKEFLNEVLGARIRVYLPLSDGQELMREILLPSSLSDTKFPWGETDR